MKPNFALNLTQEGVSLFHRSARGAWIEVGSVDMSAGPDDEQVKADLAFLRKTALGLVQGTGLFSKVVLPDSVVSYLSVQASGTDSEKTAQIAADLEQRFGIPADELVFDWVDTAGVCQVAVAELVTLEEAELFAVENRLNPVAIVAAPEAGYFTGEPMFRKTDYAAQLLGPDVEVDRDDRPFFPTAPEAVPEADDDATAAASVQSATIPARGGAQEPDTGRDPNHSPDPDTAYPTDAPSGRTADIQAETDPTAEADAGSTDPGADPKAELDAGDLGAAAFTTHRHDDGTTDIAGTRPLEAIEPRLSAIPVAPDPGDMELPAPGIGQDTGATTRKRYDPRKQVAGALSRAMTRLADTGKQGTTWARAAFGKVAENSAGMALAGVAFLRNRLTRQKFGETDAATTPEASASPVSLTPVADSAPSADPDHNPVAGSAGATVQSGPLDAMKRALQGGQGRRRTALAAVILALITFGTVTAWYLSPPSSDPLGDIPLEDRTVLASQDGAEGTDDGGTATVGDGADAAAPPTDPLQAAVDAANDADLRPRRRPDEIMPDTVAPVTDLTDEERAAILAAGLPLPGEDVEEPELSQTQQEIDTLYAVTGVQPNVVLPVAPGFDELGEDVFIPGNDPAFIGQDAVALPEYAAGPGDLEPPRQHNPVGPGIAFDLDENGFVVPTATGALTPEGATVFAGRPSIAPPNRPAPPEGTQTDDQTAASEATPNPLAGFRPRHRPTTEDRANAATFGTLTREQLAQARPRARPNSPQALAAAAVAAGESPYAVVASAPPSHRPEGFTEAVQKFLAERQQQQASAARRPQQQGNRNTPDIPTNANLAERATIKNAINLGRLNLIGVYGSSSSRRALMRLPSGRYVKVEVGDRVDGGRIASISTNSVNYVKGGQAKVLRVPSGG